MSDERLDRLDRLREKIRQFVADRDWAQFHDPKNLAMAIASEAGELLAELRWVSNADADGVLRDPARRDKIEREIGDITIALLLFCDRAGIDAISAAERKLELNAVNYPTALARGRSERPGQSEKHAFSRVIAVDWSGEAAGGRNTIWVAEVQGGALTRLENGRSREEVTDHLIQVAAVDPSLVVGLDFAFAFPGWFAESLGASDIDAVWRAAEIQGEAWLRECRSPFWGRPGMTKPDLPGHFRSAELELAGKGGSQPKSVFQIGGAGAVGTGSIRGMPQLRRLRAAGFSIWPFDAPKPPLVVEIYPRLLTGSVVKSDHAARTNYLFSKLGSLDEETRRRVAMTEDAFDAAVSALVMWEHADILRSLGASQQTADRLEGRIWCPPN